MFRLIKTDKFVYMRGVLFYIFPTTFSLRDLPKQGTKQSSCAFQVSITWLLWWVSRKSKLSPWGQAGFAALAAARVDARAVVKETAQGQLLPDGLPLIFLGLQEEIKKCTFYVIAVMTCFSFKSRTGKCEADRIKALSAGRFTPAPTLASPKTSCLDRVLLPWRLSACSTHQRENKNNILGLAYNKKLQCHLGKLQDKMWSQLMS